MKNRLFLFTLYYCIIHILFFSSSFAEKIDFGDGSSKTLTQKAWLALKDKEYEKVLAYTMECMKKYGKTAVEQQNSLKEMPTEKKEIFKYWALNDVATCLFIRGKALIEMGNKKEAKKAFNTIIKKLPYAQCWDPQGWFWNVADAAKDQLLLIDKGVKIENYTSESLVSSAWAKLGEKDYDSAIVFAKKCINLYEKEALKQQEKLKGFLPKSKAHDPWALNDVATAYFIMGEAYFKKGEYEKAYEAYKHIVEKLKYAQCWDPQGWFWKVADGAKKKMKKAKAHIRNRLYK